VSDAVTDFLKFVGVCNASTVAPGTLTEPLILAVVSTFAVIVDVNITSGKNAKRIFFIVYPLFNEI
jgi:hypothetical protein